MHREGRTTLILAAFVALLFLATYSVSPAFLSLGNLRIVAVNASYVAIAALGMFIVILSGQIDVSVGAILAFASTLTGIIAQQDVLPLPILILVVMAFGAFLGLVNATIVVGLQLHSIVATLGTLGIFRGALIVSTGGQWITIPPSVQVLTENTLLTIPIAVYIALGVAILTGIYLRNFEAGRRLYAFGSNPEGARLVGTNVTVAQGLPFILNGALVGLAGVVIASQFDNIQSNSGQGFELTVIAAVVVGGANIFGGSGTVIGTMLGALLISVLGTILIFFHVSAYWEETVQGVIILLAVAVYTVRVKGTACRAGGRVPTTDGAGR
ncbi:MAG: ABC transporter permease [Rhizobiales bacterium]|nr:ABC transporter permease [Hyphomicrobiales bacterium]